MSAREAGQPGRDMATWFRSFGAAFLVAVGFLDPGNWLTLVEGGSSFGFELLWVVLASTVIAMLLQIISARIGEITGKDFAQVCREEFPSAACAFLWALCEVSIVAVDMTVVLGTAIGLNVLFRISFLPSLVSMVVDALLFAVLLPLLEARRAQFITAMVVGIVLPCFVLENSVTSASPPMPTVGALLPKLRHETLYAAVCIVGANVIPQNFYLHSALVKDQSQSDLPFSASSHYFFLGTLCPFCAVLVVKTAVLSATVAGSHNAGLVVFTLNDAQALIEQMLNNSVSPQLFGLALLYAGQISRLNGASTGEIISEGFFDWKIAPRKHWAVIRGIALAAVVSCVWCYGSEGAYRMLLFTQVFLALHLPFTIIPLIKITSSERIMGSSKNSFFVEGCSWLFLAALTCVGVTLVFEIVVGEFEESASLRGFEYLVRTGWRMDMGEENFQFVAFGVISIVITLVLSYLVWLIFVPLRQDTPRLPWIEDPAKPANETQRQEPLEKETGAGGLSVDSVPLERAPEIKDEDQVGVAPSIAIEFSQSEPSTELPRLSSPTEAEEYSPPASQKLCEDTSLQKPGSPPVAPVGDEKPSAAFSRDTASIFVGTTVKDDVTSVVEEKEATALKETDGPADAAAKGKDDDKVEGWDKQEGISADAVISDISVSGRAVQGEGHESGRGDTGAGIDGESGSGSLSRLSGLGRAARRQFALSLDEFWATLYDLHGQPLPPGSSDLPGSRGSQPDGTFTLLSGSHEQTDSQRLSPKQKPSWKRPSTVNYQGRNTDAYMLRALTHAAASASPHLSSAQYQGYGASVNYASLSDRNNSSLPPPSDLGNYEYQATAIHGHGTPSTLGRSPNVAGGLNARALHLDGPFGGSRWSAGHQADSNAAATGYRNSLEEHSGQTLLSSQWVSNVVGGRSLFQGKHLGESDNSSFTAHQWDPLVYKSNNPSLGRWNPLVCRATGELDMKNNRPTMPSDLGEQVSFGHSPIGRRGQGENVESAPPLVFDELSPSQSHKDAFSIQTAAFTPETQSLWSRQPFERLFGPAQADYLPSHAARQARGGSGGLESPSMMGSRTSGGIGIEVEVLGRLQECVGKLLRLDGADWLFHLGDGEDEDLIAAIAAMQKSSAHLEKDLYREINTHDRHLMESYGWSQGGRTFRDPFLSRRPQSPVPNCGISCVWGGSLLISFGVWCIRRTLELSLLESRPELWGKYTYVLNRLQGILEPAFSKPSLRRFQCRCVSDRTLLDIGMRRISSGKHGGADSQAFPTTWNWGQRTSTNKGKYLTVATLLDLIRDVESAVGNRKGRTGTAAGDVAFPKGKENLASVLKRYKRRLSGKPLGSAGANGGGRRV